VPAWRAFAVSLAFAAASAAFVRSEIALASCSATAARMWIVRRLACEKSTASNSTSAPQFTTNALDNDTRARSIANRVSPPAVANCPIAARIALSCSRSRSDALASKEA
jgi:hypothetical protein